MARSPLARFRGDTARLEGEHRLVVLRMTEEFCRWQGQENPKKFKHEWQHRIGPRRRYRLVYDCLVLQAYGEPGSSAREALSAYQGVLGPIVVPLWVNVYRSLRDGKIQMERGSKVWGLWRLAAQARVPRQGIFPPQDVDPKVLVGLEIDAVLRLSNQDDGGAEGEKPHKLDRDDPRRKTYVGHVHRAKLPTAETLESVKKLSALSPQVSVLTTQFSESSASLADIMELYKFEPLSVVVPGGVTAPTEPAPQANEPEPAPVNVGVREVDYTCQGIQRVGGVLASAPGISQAVTQSDRAAGPSGSVAPDASPALTVVSAHLDPEERDVWLRLQFGAHWARKCYQKGTCTCGEPTWTENGARARYCPRCRRYV